MRLHVLPAKGHDSTHITINIPPCTNRETNAILNTRTITTHFTLLRYNQVYIQIQQTSIGNYYTIILQMPRRISNVFVPRPLSVRSRPPTCLSV